MAKDLGVKDVQELLAYGQNLMKAKEMISDVLNMVKTEINVIRSNANDFTIGALVEELEGKVQELNAYSDNMEIFSQYVQKLCNEPLDKYKTE